MAKNVVVLIDGTGNEVATHETNVLRLARMLERDASQVFYYDPGVGTQGAPSADLFGRQELVKLLGLAVGTGVHDKIGSGYRFIMSAYEPGDSLYLFGFSRGAYVVRALAGMVGKLGILERSRVDLIPYAVKLYADPLGLELARTFSETFCDRTAEIRFLGLWDTVKSVFRLEPGPPEVTSVVLPRTFTNPAVRTVRHAVAIDERRRFFRTNLWSEAQQVTDVRQVWFAGVHSDIGGGYPIDGAGPSLVTLRWMTREAKAAGLLLNGPREASILDGDGRATDAIHESLGGWWRLAEIVPKRQHAGPSGVARRFPYLPLGERRFMPPGCLIHRSVQHRIAGGRYAPPNLPGTYRVED